MFSNNKSGKRARRYHHACLNFSDNHFKQKGFTLLELLVAVSILATVAGTASMAFKDTDVRSAAAIHAAIIDELDKGIRSYRVLNHNRLPTTFDSLLQAETVTASTAVNTIDTPQLYSELALNSLAMVELTESVAKDLRDVGINKLLYVAKNQNPQGVGDCQDIHSMVKDKHNQITAGSIYLSQGSNGCGKVLSLKSGDEIAVWTGGYERIIGGDGAGFDEVPFSTDSNGKLVVAQQGAPVFLAVGAGSGSTLFDARTLGSLTASPVYRNIQIHQYNRFILLFNIGVYNADGTIERNPAGIGLAAVVGALGKTAQEELGIFDENSH